MRAVDVAGTALSNTMRSKMRTFLTVIAIVIGAFTLTLTSGIGAGVNRYVDDMVAGFGESDEMYVMPGADQQAMGGGRTGPQEYDADEAGGPSGSYGQSMLSEEDIESISELDGVTAVDPVVFVSPEYLEISDGTQYALDGLGVPADAPMMELAAGETPDPDADEITVPQTWLTAFDDDAEDFEEADPQAAVGETVEIGVRDMAQEVQTVEATVVGVSEEDLAGTGSSPMPSQTLNEELHELQNSGIETEQEESYAQAVIQVEDLAAQEDELKSELADEGLMGMTLDDMLGVVRGIINTVTWVLSGFALIALLAASFGIVNTLLMSVQERTREIGLMKALGMSRGRVFGLFSTEAVMIGVMGSVIGVGLGAGVGLAANAALVSGPLSNVAGLTLFALDPVSLTAIIALILVIAFLAGTLPAARAAQKNPIDALRYE